MDVALKGLKVVVHVHVATGFNPCSLGCCSESQHHKNPDCLDLFVSILVLLDVALKVWPECRSRLSVCEVSILVLLDVALKDESSGRYRPGSVVSILVLLDVALKA